MDERTLARWDMKVERTNTCWLWRGSLDKNGYGWFRDGTVKRAHRVAYEHFVGPIPDGMTLDHRCRVVGCVNPSHLDPATRRDNVLRGIGVTSINARKTHCVNGHEFTPENTYRAKQGRQCRACRRVSQSK